MKPLERHIHGCNNKHRRQASVFDPENALCHSSFNDLLETVCIDTSCCPALLLALGTQQFPIPKIHREIRTRFFDKCEVIPHKLPDLFLRREFQRDCFNASNDEMVYFLDNSPEQ